MANIFNSVLVPKVKRSNIDLSHSNKLSCNFGQLVPFLEEDILPGDSSYVSAAHIVQMSPLLAPIYGNIKVYQHFFYTPKRILWHDWNDKRTGGDNPNDYDSSNEPIYPTFNIRAGQKVYSVYDVHFMHKYFGTGSLADYLGFPTMNFPDGCDASSFSRNLSSHYVADDGTLQTESSSVNYIWVSNDSIANYLSGYHVCNWVRVGDEDNAGVAGQYGYLTLRQDWQYDLLPFVAYMTIYNEFYRDQNYIERFDEIGDVISDSKLNSGTFVSGNIFTHLKTAAGDINDSTSHLGTVRHYFPLSHSVSSIEYVLFDRLFGIYKRAYKHDYFTSALPDTQKGPEVRVPVGLDNVSIVGTGDPVLQIPDDVKADSEYKQGIYNSNGQLITDHFNIEGNSLGVNINDLREMSALQRWFELNARAGGRMIEYLLSHFGVKSSDARLDRPEWIGGSVSPVSVKHVFSTAATDVNSVDSPLGSYAGYGSAATSNKPHKRFFEEDGILLGILSIMPDSAYSFGMPKKYTKRDRVDFFDRMFEGLGEQPIMQQELLYGTGENNEVFGYTPRYAEYKYHANEFHGDFKESLSYWHFGRFFKDNPRMGAEFIEVDPDESHQDLNRIFAVEDNNYDHFYVDSYIIEKMKRKIKKYNNPHL